MATAYVERPRGSPPDRIANCYLCSPGTTCGALPSNSVESELLALGSVLRSRFVMAGRIRTHYVEAGDSGPVVVLCHGGGPGASGEIGFGPLIPYPAERFQVYAPDGIGGYGEAELSWPATEGTQSRVDQLEALMDTLCLERVCLPGNSQGAWVTAKYALEHLDCVSHLFLVASMTIAHAIGLPMLQISGIKDPSSSVHKSATKAPAYARSVRLSAICPTSPLHRLN